MEKKLKIILIEDNNEESKMFQSFINKRNDITLVSTTKSSNEALILVKKHSPNAIILDLELDQGNGSGFEFLNNLKDLSLPYKPLIIVTTYIASQTIYDKLHKDFVDLIFYKKQPDYSPKLVIDALVLLAHEPYLKSTSISSPEEKDIEIKNKINKELDLIGISYKLKGREYLFEGIYFLLTNDNSNITVFQYLSNHYKLLISSISRAIQTSINHTWRTSSIEDLRINYTAQINYNTGVPTPTEFIYYIVNKLKQ